MHREQCKSDGSIKYEGATRVRVARREGDQEAEGRLNLDVTHHSPRLSDASSIINTMVSPPRTSRDSEVHDASIDDMTLPGRVHRLQQLAEPARRRR